MHALLIVLELPSQRSHAKWWHSLTRFPPIQCSKTRNYWCSRLRFCTIRLNRAANKLGYNEMNLLWIMPLVQDRSLDLLTSSPARYHCTTDAPEARQELLRTITVNISLNTYINICLSTARQTFNQLHLAVCLEISQSIENETNSGCNAPYICLPGPPFIL